MRNRLPSAVEIEIVALRTRDMLHVAEPEALIPKLKQKQPIPQARIVLFSFFLLFCNGVLAVAYYEVSSVSVCSFGSARDWVARSTGGIK